jgi:hypothetical protein
MLAAHRPGELAHQRADLARDLLQMPNVRAAGQVEHRPDVQAAHRRVAVERPFGLMPRKDLAKARDELWQPRRIDCRVLHKRHRLARTGHAQEQRQGGFAAGPNMARQDRIERRKHVRKARLSAQPLE